MPIDNTIQFNGYNSYRVTETVWSAPFGVQGMAYITHSFDVYATSPLGAATRARTRFFAADGSITGTSDHSFAVPAVFTAVALTLAVPANSVLCQLSFSTSGTWWLAAPKSEEGQTASPYNTNYAAQLSLITPNGAYLGLLTTSQIVVAGTIADPSESLFARLITINNNAITLSATSAAHGSAITLIQAGQITLSGSTIGTLPVACIGAGSVELAKLGTTIISGGYVDTDLIDVDTLIARMVLTNTVVAKILTNDATDPECWATIGVKDGVPTTHYGIFVYRKSGAAPDPEFAMYSNTSGEIIIRNRYNEVIFWSNETIAGGFTQIMCPTNGNYIGADHTGCYKINAGVKTYL